MTKTYIFKNNKKYEIILKNNGTLIYLTNHKDKENAEKEKTTIDKIIQEKGPDFIIEHYNKRKIKQNKEKQSYYKSISEGIHQCQISKNYRVKIKYKGSLYSLGTYSELNTAKDIRDIAFDKRKNKTFESFYNEYKSLFKSRKREYDKIIEMIEKEKESK